MKYCLLAFALVVVAVIGACCEQPESVQKPQVSSGPEKELAKENETEAPLLLDDEPLLLLDDEGSEVPTGPQADNSRCFVCHINYMEEDIAVTHAAANMGCKDCHGESDEHIADESWASGGNGTAPDTMFPKPTIVPFCMGCHTKKKIDTVQHKPLFANMEKMVCTDCHGKHRITTPRKCKWK
ncbi:MAG: multiheme c-type cytochrome [Planctomycetota bacterium]|jgi:hypothetical protein